MGGTRERKTVERETREDGWTVKRESEKGSSPDVQVRVSPSPHTRTWLLEPRTNNQDSAFKTMSLNLLSFRTFTSYMLLL